MKKLFTLIFLSASIFILGSCKKCGTCTTTVTTTVNQPTPGYPQTSTSTQELCGDDLKEADGSTTTASSSVGQITATSTSVCNCVTN